MTLKDARHGNVYHIPSRAGSIRITRFIGYRYSEYEKNFLYDLEVSLNFATGYVSLPADYKIEQSNA